MRIIAGILKRSPQWFFDSELNIQSASEPTVNYQVNQGLSIQVYQLIQEVHELRKRLNTLEVKIEN